ncbi:MAG: T9SS type A sorting domain-containing protein [Ignavibacteriae bacterium]|nr:T9SS type A sorting domain-containing protein [Ignavibacteriota bacterium]
MRKLSFTLLLFIISFGVLFAQVNKNRTISSAFDDGKVPFGHILKYGITILENYPGSIPGTSSFWDYQTNGASLNGLYVRNDTVIVAYPTVDSTDALGTTSRVAYYIYSADAGLTWSEPLQVQGLPLRSGYPEIYLFENSGLASVIISGRKYNASGSRGGVWTDASFGLGSISGMNVPDPGRDYFGYYLGNNVYGGVYSSPNTAATSDSLIFIKFNASSNSFSGKTTVTEPFSSINSNVRYRFAANSAGTNLITMWYDNAPAAYSMRYKTSTNGGTTWGTAGTLQTAFGFGGVVNGDTCSPWFGIDVAFKPNTTSWGAVWSTLYPTATGQTSGDAQGCKILFSSPGINGGLPVEVAGKSNMTIISNPTLFANRLALQVGSTPLSHPSIAYSGNGARILVTFSAFQPGDSLDGFTFQDIYYTYSDNGGSTWATPVNLTNTPTWDEMYPELSETGNTVTSFKVKFQATRGPGSSSFTDNAPVYRVYNIYKAFNIVGIENIGSSVPSKFGLNQNYPNPFNPVTKIRFDVAKTSKITLRVFNIAGQEVETLVNGETVTAGTKEITFNGSSLPSGIYFYTLSNSEGFKETKKMMLIK